MFLNKYEFSKNKSSYNGNEIELLEISHEFELLFLNSVQNLMITESKCIISEDTVLLREAEEGFLKKLIDGVSGFFKKIWEWIKSFFVKSDTIADKFYNAAKASYDWATNNKTVAIAGIAALKATYTFYTTQPNESKGRYKKVTDFHADFLKKVNGILANPLKMPEGTDGTLLKEGPMKMVVPGVAKPDGDTSSAPVINYIFSGDPAKKPENTEIDGSKLKGMFNTLISLVSGKDRISNQPVKDLEGLIKSVNASVDKAIEIKKKETDFSGGGSWVFVVRTSIKVISEVLRISAETFKNFMKDATTANKVLNDAKSGKTDEEASSTEKTTTDKPATEEKK